MSIKISIISILTIFLLISCDSNNITKPNNPQSEIYKLAFYAHTDFYMNIYIINDDGSGLIKLTNDLRNCSAPSWSPNGDKIAYTNYHNLFIINADSTHHQKMIKENVNSRSPVWSIDGQHITYLSNGKILCIDTTGQNLTTLATFDNDIITFLESPLGDKIAFIIENGLYKDIYVMDYNGENKEFLHTYLGDITTLSWSYEGDFLLFTKIVNNNYEIYSLNISNQDTLRLTYNSADDCKHSWSPTKNSFCFTSHNESGIPNIYIMDINSKNIICISNSFDIYKSYWSYLNWSSDGNKIAAVLRSNITDLAEIYIFDLYQKSYKKITEGLEAYNFYPIYSPVIGSK